MADLLVEPRRPRLEVWTACTMVVAVRRDQTITAMSQVKTLYRKFMANYGALIASALFRRLQARLEERHRQWVADQEFFDIWRDRWRAEREAQRDAWLADKMRELKE